MRLKEEMRIRVTEKIMKRPGPQFAARWAHWAGVGTETIVAEQCKIEDSTNLGPSKVGQLREPSARMARMMIGLHSIALESECAAYEAFVDIGISTVSLEIVCFLEILHYYERGLAGKYRIADRKSIVMLWK